MNQLTRKSVSVAAKPWPYEPAQNSADYFDNQYNNRLRVLDFANFMSRWGEMSKLTRQTLACELNVAYSSNARGSDAGQALDIFLAKDSGDLRKPVLVFIHGGYWRSLDKSDFSFVAQPFVEAGACVVIPNYDLCPAVTLDVIVMQQVEALAWVYRNIESYGGDPSRIRIVGHSAGGHLAAMLLTCQWQNFASDLPPNLVKAAMSLSGLYDLQSIQACPYLQTDLRLTNQVVARSSPYALPAPRGTLISLCGADESAEFLRHNALIEAAWGSASVPRREALLGKNHFSILDDLCTVGGRANQLALEMLGI